MIRIDRSGIAAPQTLLTKGPAHLKSNIEPKVQDGSLKSKHFSKDIYGGENVKATLWRMQHKKCCFCEQKYEYKSWTVEHFRPKTSVRRADGVRRYPGYWWLAYEFENLLFCCPNCNSPKSDKFPLKQGSLALREGQKPSVVQEEPLVINPAIVDPEPHIEWQWKNGVGYVPVGTTEMGAETIRLCKLATRDALTGLRYDHYKDARKWIKVWRDAKKLGQQRFVDQAITALHDLVAPQALFAGMMRHVLRQHRIL